MAVHYIVGIAIVYSTGQPRLVTPSRQASLLFEQRVEVEPEERVNVVEELYLQASNSYKLVRSCACCKCMHDDLTFYLLVRLLRSNLLLQSIENYAFASWCSRSHGVINVPYCSNDREM